MYGRLPLRFHLHASHCGGTVDLVGDSVDVGGCDTGNDGFVGTLSRLLVVVSIVIVLHTLTYKPIMAAMVAVITVITSTAGF